MPRRLVLLGSIVAALVTIAPAGAAQAQTVTATGTGQARVLPKNRQNNASIVAAVDAAHKASIAGAVSEAHEYAVDYATAVGLTLGSVMSVSDVQTNSFYGPGQTTGPFGPDQYCGTVEQLVGRPVKREGQAAKIQEGAPMHRAPVRVHDAHGDLLGKLSWRRRLAPPADQHTANGTGLTRPGLAVSPGKD